MSKKNKIIISVTAAVLALAVLLPVGILLAGNEPGMQEPQTDGETTQNETYTAETEAITDVSTSTSASDIPPIEIPDDPDDEVVQDDIILDVGDKERNPDPEVVDATVEYETKGGGSIDE